MYASYIKAGTEITPQHSIGTNTVTFTVSGVKSGLGNVPTGIKITWHPNVVAMSPLQGATPFTESTYKIFDTPQTTTSNISYFMLFSVLTTSNGLSYFMSIPKSGFQKNTSKSYTIQKNLTGSSGFKYMTYLNGELQNDFPMISYPSDSALRLDYGQNSKGDLTIKVNAINDYPGMDSAGSTNFHLQPLIDTITVY